MKAQLVRENINFERGQDPKHSIGIGKRALIDKWFEEWAPDAKYVINSDLSIDVQGHLDFSNTPVASLPDNLNVERGLDLDDTQISYLPDNLSVGRNLYIEKTQITSLPDNLSIRGSLYLRNTPINSLPDSLRIVGKIYKNF